MPGPAKNCGPGWFRLVEFYCYTVNKQTNTKTNQKYIYLEEQKKLQRAPKTLDLSYDINVFLIFNWHPPNKGRYCGENKNAECCV